jgi:glycosyltransferase involved in cell wall biosynthesis
MSAAEPPLISVVIPVLNGGRTIADCLASVVCNDYPVHRREILVVDNGSTDDTAQIIERFPVRYLRAVKRGAARARNAGIEASSGEIVAFVDVDCVASTAWLREVANGFADTTVGGVAGEILPFPPSTAAERHAARIRHLSPERYLRRPVFPFAVTANLAFRRKVFDTVGLMDPRSPRGGESTDFCTRFFRSTGLELRFAPRAVVFHRHRSNTRELLRQHWSYGRGHAFLYIKYRDEVPWGWPQTVRVYRDLLATASGFGAQAMSYLGGRTDRTELEFAWFELLRKVALRAGFVRQAVSEGHLYI